jgi:hypothetical protein
MLSKFRSSIRLSRTCYLRSTFAKNSLRSFSSDQSFKPFNELKKMHGLACQMIKENEKLSDLTSYKNLKVLCNNVNSVVITNNDPLPYLDFLAKRTSSYKADDVKSVYNLVGVGEFTQDAVDEIVEMLNVLNSSKQMDSVIANYSFLTKKFYQDYLTTMSCTQTVTKYLNDEKEKHCCLRHMMNNKLMKRSDEFSHDMFLHNLVVGSPYDVRTIEKLFPANNFDLLHSESNSFILQRVNAVVNDLKLCTSLKSYRKTNNAKEILDTVYDRFTNSKELPSDSTKQIKIDLTRDNIHKALIELSDVYSNTWNDYCLIALSRLGIYPKGTTFGEGLRLKQENICIQFLKDETRLSLETYANEILTKCTENGWLELPKLIKRMSS